MSSRSSLTGCLKQCAKLLDKMKKASSWLALTLLLVLLGALCAPVACAAGQPGEYLSYQEPKPSGASWVSTLAYVITLGATFLLVIGLAYFTSRFLGQKMGRVTVGNDNRIVLTLPLGPNRAVHVVEIAGKFLVLGVTDHNISLLQEINSEDQTAKLRAIVPAAPAPQFDTVFQRHLASLQHMSDKFPGVFGGYNRSDNENEREKR